MIDTEEVHLGLKSKNIISRNFNIIDNLRKAGPIKGALGCAGSLAVTSVMPLTPLVAGVDLADLTG